MERVQSHNNGGSLVAVFFYEASDDNDRIVERLGQIDGVTKARYARSSAGDEKEVCLVTAESPDSAPSVKNRIDQMFLPTVMSVTRL